MWRGSRRARGLWQNILRPISFRSMKLPPPLRCCHRGHRLDVMRPLAVVTRSSASTAEQVSSEGKLKEPRGELLDYLDGVLCSDSKNNGMGRPETAKADEKAIEVRVGDILEKLTHPLSQEQYTEAIRLCKQVSNFDAGYLVFEHASRWCNEGIRAPAARSLLESLARGRVSITGEDRKSRLAIAFRVLDTIKQSGETTTKLEAYRRVVKLVLKFSDGPDGAALARQLATEMMNVTLPTNSRYWDVTILCAETVEQGIQLVEMMKANGVERTIETYIALMQVCRRMRDWRAAFLVRQKLWEDELSEHTKVANALLDVVGTCGKKEQMESLFAKLKDRRDFDTYRVMMNGYANIRDIDGVLKTLGEFTLANTQQEMHPRELRLYNNALDMCRKAVKHSKGIALFEDTMRAQERERGLIPNAETFRHVILLKHDVGLFEEAISLVDSFLSKVQDASEVDDEVLRVILRMRRIHDGESGRAEVYDLICQKGLRNHWRDREDWEVDVTGWDALVGSCAIIQALREIRRSWEEEGGESDNIRDLKIYFTRPDVPLKSHPQHMHGIIGSRTIERTIKNEVSADTEIFAISEDLIAVPAVEMEAWLRNC